MSKEEIVDKIDKMRAQSLWEKVFSDIGDESNWKHNISVIRKCRNKVAHHRSISQKEYNHNLKVLKMTNADLDDAISKIQIRDFTNENKVDILSGFGELLKTCVKISEFYSSYNFESILSNMSSAIKNISNITIPSANYIAAVNRSASVIQNINIPTVSSDVVKSMSEMANAISKLDYPFITSSGNSDNTNNEGENNSEDNDNNDNDDTNDEY